MLRLETLGGLILTGDGGRQVVPQRRRLALLALLAVAGERGVSRDKLIGVLWPESSSDNARHALEQLVYSLRRQLPESPVQGVDPLRLDRAVVETDLDEFALRLSAGELAEAVALYRGPFLDGFFVADAPEFERWVDRERARLAGEHARALRTLAEQSEAAGRHTSEIDYWRQLTLTDPLGERSATDLVRALAAAGDWVAAARAAREYAARVREELPGVTPTDLEALVNRLQRARRPPGPGAPAESAAAGLYDREGARPGRGRDGVPGARPEARPRGRAQAASARAAPPPPTRDGSAGRSRFWRSSITRTSSSSTTRCAWAG